MTRHFIEVIHREDGWWAWRCNTCREWAAGFAEKREAVNDADAHLTAARRGVA
jgi:hypothetical protein